ncbi:gliding motility-associated C-terminal domain-containing protein [Flavobacterium sp. PL02]|uniref:gliding motility-associated C-terminal domain-containing protein n=1 Tax=Flavobacterium sp. PL02 TaxID=3088354 RepID=UPI002B233C2A|nr:gliding motility-associated C-terminal domain-containing protein [Flavobacterium sp. PL02]MEA9411879.1 gliding motility-associated C-terminal domain-containing protein [Flavobacterium sp. PL02]
MVKNYLVALKILLFFIVLFLLPSQSIAQCAGIDTDVKICDIENPVHESINLLGLLDGNPTAGGKWTDDSNTQELDTITGILYAQNISRGGVYQFTYTVPATPGCVSTTAKLRITIGAYAGVPAPYATPCSDRETYNLFEAFNGTVMGPHKNGTWTNGAGQIVPSGFPIKGLQGTFKFTYTVPPVPGCILLIPSVTVWITVVRAPEPGNAKDLLLCGSTDLATYTNFDLHGLLVGQDPGGEWSGPGIVAPGYKVNLQKIFDTQGAGDYEYTYTVLAPTLNGHRPCSNKSVSAVITLEKSLDFTGATLVVDSDICETEIASATYLATLTRGPEVIPNGKYNITYTISGPTATSVKTESVIFNNGVVTFPLEAVNFQEVGAFKVEITSIVAEWNKGVCKNIVDNLSDILNVYPIPNLDSAKLKIDPICQKENAVVQITGASKLLNGTYDIVYKLSGANIANAQGASITVVNGVVPDFIIPAALISKDGNTSVVITKITNSVTKCTNTANVIGNIVVKPLPNATNFKVQIDDFCLNEPVSVTISGLGILKDIAISYTISGSNSATTQRINLLVTNAKASFIIPQNLLFNTGTTRLTITKVTNNETTCGIAPTGLLDDFLINAIPTAPTTNPQFFCKSDEATVANLVPNGTQYKWYDSVTATTPLGASTILVSGNYYVKVTAPGGCVSQESLSVVTVNDTPAPVLIPKGQDFCGINNPTIADLSNNTNASASIVWYDAPDNGNQLTKATLLEDNATYYGFDFSSTTNCFSNEVLIAKVSLTNCTNEEEYADFFIPDGFSPNGDGTNDTYTIPDIDFLYPDYTLEIYNRYGNLMFTGNKNKPEWDGKNSDSKVIDGVAPNGVYFYVVHFNKDNRSPLQGRLYLNR